MTHDDDARPIPLQGVPSGGSRPGAAEEAPQDVYLVDTRGRRRVALPSSRPQLAEPSQPSRPSQPPQPPQPPQRIRRRGRRVRWAVGLVAAAVVAWLGFVAYTPWHAWGTVARVDSTPTGARGAAPRAGHVYLLVGSDSRAGLTAAQRKKLGTGSVAGRRTDSIILVYVPSGGGKSALISIPRDSYVPIPGHGSNKINAAYAIGGAPLLVETVEKATDLRIDGYVEVGFGGFVGVVDGLGGVTICVPFDMNDKEAHINLKKGCQNLTGANALGYVRARYSDPRGDIGRAARQRQFLGAIMKKTATPSTVLIPTRWWTVTHDVAQGLTVGQDTTLMDAGRVVLALRAVSRGEALSLVVPLSSVNYQTSAGSSVKWDTERARALFTMLRDGEPLTVAPAGTNGVPSGR